MAYPSVSFVWQLWIWIQGIPSLEFFMDIRHWPYIRSHEEDTPLPINKKASTSWSLNPWVCYEGIAQLNWSSFKFTFQWSRVQVLSGSLEAYMIVNFRTCKINRVMQKLTRTPKKNNPNICFGNTQHQEGSGLDGLGKQCTFRPYLS